MTTDPYADPNCDQDAMDSVRAIRESWKTTQPAPTCFEDVVALCKRWAASPEAAECRAIISRRLEQHSLVITA